MQSPGSTEGPNQDEPKEAQSKHVTIKMAQFKNKERMLKAAREKQEVMYKGAPIRLSADYSIETLQAGKEWQEIFQVIKSKILQPRLLYAAGLSFKMEG